MDQEPQAPEETRPSGSGGNSGIFQNINTVVAGLTGLVIAVGGLAAATKGVLWDKERTEASAPAAAQAIPADEQAAAGEEEEAAPEDGAPTLYKGETAETGIAVTIEWKDKNWVLTEGTEDYNYDDLTSDDEARYEAVSNGNYLRWPVAGGEVDESSNRVKWSTYGSVKPVAESSEE